MKKITLAFGVACFLLIGLSGCSSTPDKPVIKTTEKFNVEDISLEVVQSVSPEIEYHTSNEIKTIVSNGILTNLKNSNLITSDSAMNSLEIRIIYHRTFVGGATPFSLDSLAYPIFDYVINVKDGDKLLRTISRKNLIFTGGLAMDLKAVAGLLRDKSDEIVFMEALSRTVVKSIEQLNK